MVVRVLSFQKKRKHTYPITRHPLNRKTRRKEHLCPHDA